MDEVVFNFCVVVADLIGYGWEQDRVCFVESGDLLGVACLKGVVPFFKKSCDRVICHGLRLVKLSQERLKQIFELKGTSGKLISKNESNFSDANRLFPLNERDGDSLLEPQGVDPGPVFPGDVEEAGCGIVGDSVEDGFLAAWAWSL